MSYGSEQSGNRLSDGEIDPMFSTLAILDQSDKFPKSKVTIPSPRAVDEAKKWVDENEK